MDPSLTAGLEQRQKPDRPQQEQRDGQILPVRRRVRGLASLDIKLGERERCNPLELLIRGCRSLGVAALASVQFRDFGQLSRCCALLQQGFMRRWIFPVLEHVRPKLSDR